MEPVDRILIVLLNAAEYLSEEEAPAKTLESSYHDLTKAIKESVPSSFEILDIDDPSRVITHYFKYPDAWHSFLRNELVNSALDQDAQVQKLTTALMSRLPGKPTTHYPRRRTTTRRENKESV